MPSDYKVKIEVFEGPLDLLLYLIKKEEVDIYSVSIERITGQYLEYPDTFRMLDLEIAGEFVVMPGTATYIHARAVLPLHLQAPGANAAHGDPTSDPIPQLIGCKKF